MKKLNIKAKCSTSRGTEKFISTLRKTIMFNLSHKPQDVIYYCTVHTISQQTVNALILFTLFTVPKLKLKKGQMIRAIKTFKNRYGSLSLELQ